MATVNAAEAEQAILDLLEPLFCSNEVLAKLEASVQKRLVDARRQRTKRKSSEEQLRSQLADAEAETQRLVQWIAKGKLVEDLEKQMEAAEARRDYLRSELARARAATPSVGVDTLPTEVRKIVSDLRGMLDAGQIEKVKSALSRLVTRIEVHEDPRPGKKRPGAKLLLRGSLEALLQMTRKVTTGGSPGGICTLVTVRTPTHEYKLQGRRYHAGDAADEGRQAAVSGWRWLVAGHVCCYSQCLRPASLPPDKGQPDTTYCPVGTDG